MLYLRCHSCPNAEQTGPFEFELPPDTAPAEQRCPLCETTVDSGRVERLALIHYEPPRSPALRGRQGSGKLACSGAPSKSITSEYKIVTGSARAVNCPECLQTEAFAAELAAAQIGMSNEQRASVERARARKLTREDVRCQTSEVTLAERSTQPTTAPHSGQPLTGGDSNKP